MIFGTFDRLHPGHEFFLKEAAKRGSVTVIVARDRNVERIKGKPARENERARAAAIQESFPAFYVQLGDAEDFLTAIREINPDLILLGYDQLLPPGVDADDLPCPVECIGSFQPERFKSSLL